MQKKDRLAAGYTLEKYERIYRQAFYDAAKKADPNWKIGKPIKDGALDSVTRELAESGKSPAQATCLLYTSPSPRDTERSRMPSSA